MVLGLVAKELFKQGTKYLSRYYALEGKAFSRLYTGFPHSKTIGRGVRHGLTTGSVIGSFFNDDSNLNGGNSGIPQKKFRSKAHSQYQTRRRYTRRSSCWYPGKQQSNKYRRRSYSR